MVGRCHTNQHRKRDSGRSQPSQAATRVLPIRGTGTNRCAETRSIPSLQSNDDTQGDRECLLVSLWFPSRVHLVCRKNRGYAVHLVTLLCACNETRLRAMNRV